MKKKLLGMLISLIMLLTLLLGSTAIALADDCPNIRVLLTIGSPTSFDITLNGTYNVSYDGIVLGGIGPRGYKVVVEGSSVALYMDSTAVARGTTVALSPQDDKTISISHPTYGSKQYKGDFVFTVCNGSLQLVNQLDIETYLYGVLPYEMSNSFPLEALKAQAVCARTFAAMRMAGTKPTDTYDLDDTGAHAQVYEGYDESKTVCIDAVNATAKEVLKYGDSAYVNCYYSASNGGWTDITQHRWTATEPLKAYDQIKADPYDIANPSSLQERLVLPGAITAENPIQYQKWSGGVYVPNENSPAGVATISKYLRLCALQAVRDKGYIANVSDDIEILGFSDVVPRTYDTGSGQHHGGTTKADGSVEYNGNDVTGTNNCKDMTQAYVTMTVMASRYATGDESSGNLLGDVDRNGAISIADYTYVRLFILGLQQLPDEAINISDIDRNGSVSISDYTYIRLHILGIKAIEGRTNDGIIREPVQITCSINFPDIDVGGPYQSFFVSSLGLFTVEHDETNWYIYQRRYGHGIGLSQRGAQQRANSTDPAVNTYTAILDFYFPDYPGYPDVHIAPLY